MSGRRRWGAVAAKKGRAGRRRRHCRGEAASQAKATGSSRWPRAGGIISNISGPTSMWSSNARHVLPRRSGRRSCFPLLVTWYKRFTSRRTARSEGLHKLEPRTDATTQPSNTRNPGERTFEEKYSHQAAQDAMIPHPPVSKRSQSARARNGKNLDSRECFRVFSLDFPVRPLDENSAGRSAFHIRLSQLLTRKLSS